MKQLVPLMLCLLMAACAPQNRQVSLKEEAAPSPDQQLITFLGTAHTGTTAAFSNTTLGSVTVTAKDIYVSALGELCREGLAITPRGNTRIAVCRKDENAPWQLAPTIFCEGAL